jgi:hypothetical protein
MDKKTKLEDRHHAQGHGPDKLENVGFDSVLFGKSMFLISDLLCILP